MHSLVMSYLVHHCYDQTAEAFARTSKTPLDPGVIHGIKKRKTILSLVRSGEAQQAIQKTEEEFPGVIEKDSEVCFMMKTQVFIELIRVGDVSNALLFASNELKPLSEKSTSFAKRLQDHIPLLAYPNPLECPHAHLLSQKRREESANVLNRAILKGDNLPGEPPIESVISQIAFMKALLHGEEKWNLQSFMRERDQEGTGGRSSPQSLGSSHSFSDSDGPSEWDQD
eukprot:CAMPEP_0201533600 /NCGR_PEP_ID=MMETSP0161_2-20130828/53732_1 /ASSEMBLY_ACC=CAM_ASM_000251 /TAXON_ID=180227 /ORGANISM="Neoparamoeba aestuarina, Strain SoJaBio B1-5/56/2" /LENGTH=226 /DNA_ID=CAMNT_0047937715 /DNA_START=172 /DNA_END=852 /DNA_ORIENTATION=+